MNAGVLTYTFDIIMIATALNIYMKLKVDPC